MTNAAKFLECIIHASHMVYGLKLKPLTLFHIAYLNNLGSPLILGGNINNEDLFKAAVVCSSKDHSETNRKFKNIFLPFLFPLFNHQKEYEKWNAYFADFMSLPEYWDTSGEKEKLPFVLTCAAAVVKVTGWDFDKVFYEMPLGKVLWLNAAFGWLESGKTNIKSDEELKAIAFLESLKAEKLHAHKEAA